MLERDLLQLAQQPLLAVADLGDQRPGGLVVESIPSSAARWPSHRGSSRGLTGLSSAIGLPAALTALSSAAGTLLRPSSRAKKATVTDSGSIPAIAVATALDVRLLPALDPVGDHESAAERERHRRQRVGHGLGRAGVALEDLHARRAARGLGHGAQPRAALADAAVVAPWIR